MTRQSRVLVVDDEEQIRRLLRMILMRTPEINAAVHEASSAEDAIQTIRHNEFDLVITDYRMGVKTGVDFLEVAVRERPNMRRVLITAFGEMDIGVEAINRGRVDGFVRKPWENARLVALVRNLLSTPRPGESPGAAPPAPAAPAPSVATAPADLQAEITSISRSLQQLRVRLGLGALSPEGYERAAAELTQRRAALEARLHGRA